MTGVRNDAAGISPKNVGNGAGNSKSWAERPPRADGDALAPPVVDAPPTIRVDRSTRFTVETRVDTTPDQNDDDEWDAFQSATVTVSETPEFDRRVRLLLGVTDQSAPVTTCTEEGDCGTEATPESWNTVTVACAGRELTLDGYDALPRMLRRVEYAGSEPVRDTVMRYLGRAEPVGVGDATLHMDNGQQITGHINGLGGRTVYLRGRDRGYELSDVTHITAAETPPAAASAWA